MAMASLHNKVGGKELDIGLYPLTLRIIQILVLFGFYRCRTVASIRCFIDFHILLDLSSFN